MTIKMNWGYKIALVYLGFVALILVLVFASSKQHFDLVSNDYYGEEIAYQKVIDAGKNQSALAAPISVHANENAVILDFPESFKGKTLSGSVQFYCAMDSKYDRDFKINSSENSVSFNREKLANQRYIAKISLECEGKKYYQESEIYLHQ